MRQMLLLLNKRGYKQVSLSVRKSNYALKMYLAVGFVIIEESEEECIVVCKTEGICNGKDRV